MDSRPGPLGEDVWRKIGSELRRLRIERGLSLAELCRKMHYSKGYLSKIELGDKRMTPEVARRADEALGTDGALAALLPNSALPAERAGVTITQECPYLGLASFGPDEAHWFFGREQATAELVAQLDQRLVSGGGPLAVVAPSGAGKSSLLAAGLVPELARGVLPGSQTWTVLRVTPGGRPLSGLAARVAALAGVDMAGAGEEPERFAGLCAAVVAGRPGETPSMSRLLLIVDQFEETFTQCRSEPERQAFITALCTVAQTSAVLVVLGLRADFYARCLAYPPLLAALNRGHLALGPMNIEQLRAVITRPARVEGLELEPGLVELLVRDSGTVEDPDTDDGAYDVGALPLLAHALRATWQQRDGTMLTVAGYRRTGGIRQALATTAERAYGGLDPDEQRIARQVLLRLVNVSEQGAGGDTRRRVLRSRLVEAREESVDAVLEVFARSRLLTFDSAGVEITHEALLRAWPRLRGWIDTDRAGSLVRQDLEDAAAVWDRDRSDTALLYRGARLETAREWASSISHAADLSPLAADFLAASNQRGHRVTRLRRAALALLCILALVAVGAAVIARADAKREHNNAIFNQLIANAERERGTDVSLAAQLDLTAYRMRPSPELSTALLSAGSNVLSTPLTGHTGTVNSVVFSPDGRTLATGGGDQSVRLWNITDPVRPNPLGAPLTGQTDIVHSLAFSPNGRILAVGDRTVRLWNVTHPIRPTPLGVPLSDCNTIAETVVFSSDGRTLAVGGDDHTVRLWNVTDPTHPIALGAPLTGHTAIVYGVAFSPDGHTLASGSRDHTVRLWNVTDPTHPTALGAPLTGHTSTVNSVAFSPDGRTLASGGDDQTVRLWNITNPAAPTSPNPPLTGHAGSVNSVAFSPDGRTLASGSTGDIAQLWNVTDPSHPAQLGPSLTGHTSAVVSVTFSPDGHSLATGGADLTARLWDVPTVILTGHTNNVLAVAFSPDGRTLASGGDDQTVRLWDVADPAHPAALGPPLTGHNDYVVWVAFSPDGRTLASGGDDQTVRLWNVADPNHPTALGPPLTGHTTTVETVMFSPDGRTLASGSRDQSVRLWNVADPAHPAALGAPLTGHTGTIYSVAFSPDGRTLASGGDDQIVRLWNVADPVHPMPLGPPLTGHTDGVEAVGFSPDGHVLATASDDRTIRLWELNIDQAIQRICATTANTLTPAKWEQYVSEDLPYQPPCR